MLMTAMYGNESTIDQLSLREKVAQMIMVRIRGDFYNLENGYRKNLEKWIKDYQIGGVITFGGSVHGTFHNIKMFQEWSAIPLLVAADYERGTGQWVKGGTLFPTNMALAATGNPDYAYAAGKITASEASVLGVHIILAPVLDVNSNSENPIINFRAFSDNAEMVADFGIQFIKGIQDGGRLACAKHFPGHGNTNVDSHTSLPTIKGSRSSLENLELLPFKAAVDAGVKSIMTGHIALPGLDKYKNPASQSWLITTGLLKNEWKFDGLIITDGMEMGGLTQATWAGESAIRAIEAGADILLLPQDVELTIDAIVSAVKNNRLTEARITQSVRKILKEKNNLSIFDSDSTPSWDRVEKKLGVSIHRKSAAKMAEESITLVKNELNLLPLKPEKIQKLTHIILSTDDGLKEKLHLFINDISHTHGNVNEIYIRDPLNKREINDLLAKVDNNNPVLISALIRIHMDKGISTIDPSHHDFLKKLHKKNKNTILVSFGSPYLPEYNMMSSYLCVYGYGNISLKSAANSIFGRRDITGKLPVNLSPIYQRGHGIDIKKRQNGFGYYHLPGLEESYSILDKAIQSGVFPGAQIFISLNGDIVSSRGFGSLTYDLNSAKVDSTTLYDVASLTKILVSTPIFMKLMSRNQLHLNHTIDQFFPEFKGKWKDKVTLYHLLTHSSGIEPYCEYFLEDPLPDRNEIIEDIVSRDLIYEPGTNMKYSDLAIILLGQILEKTSKRSLDELADLWIFKSLNMGNTSYNPDTSNKNIAPTELDNRFRHMLMVGEVHDENAFLLDGVAPHAGIFSTASDIGIYFQTLLNGGTWLGKRKFNRNQINVFIEKQNVPPGSDRAIGFDTPTRNGKSSAGDLFSDHSFGHLGFTGTSVWADMDRNIIIVLLTNRVHPTREKEGIYMVRREFHTKVMEALLKAT